MRRETRDCKETTDTSAGRGGPVNPAEGSKKKSENQNKKDKYDHTTSKEKHAESTA